MAWIEQSGSPHCSFVVELFQLFVNEPGTLCKPDTAAGTPVVLTERVELGEYVSGQTLVSEVAWL